jgi:galactokinase
VNIIGEHIDYNDGFVLPMAIPLYTVIVGSKNNSANRMCRIKSLEGALGENNYVEFSLDELKPQAKPFTWANYIIGVVANFSGKL